MINVSLKSVTGPGYYIMILHWLFPEHVKSEYGIIIAESFWSIAVVFVLGMIAYDSGYSDAN